MDNRNMVWKTHYCKDVIFFQVDQWIQWNPNINFNLFFLRNRKIDFRIYKKVQRTKNRQGNLLEEQMLRDYPLKVIIPVTY